MPGAQWGAQGRGLGADGQQRQGLMMGAGYQRVFSTDAQAIVTAESKRGQRAQKQWPAGCAGAAGRTREQGLCGATRGQQVPMVRDTHQRGAGQQRVRTMPRDGAVRLVLLLPPGAGSPRLQGSDAGLPDVRRSLPPGTLATSRDNH